MSEQPLTHAELDRLADVLKRCGGKNAMNVEMLDGFLAALICSPESVLPSEYLPEIWGGDDSDGLAFESKSDLQELLSLIMRHWNATGHILQSGGNFFPVLLEDDSGVSRGNAWAVGFLRGMGMRRNSWSDLLDNEQHGGSLVPIMALAHENDPDPNMRSYAEPVSAELRDKLIAGVMVGVPAIYRYFAGDRKSEARRLASAGTFRRDAPKVGRNDPCPCGSGRKFKHCCAKMALH
jgi:uncharacterized protein